MEKTSETINFHRLNEVARAFQIYETDEFFQQFSEKCRFFALSLQNKDRGGSSPLHEAATSGDDKAVELILAGGADRNTKDTLVSILR
jgi:hypothetical protein